MGTRSGTCDLEGGKVRAHPDRGRCCRRERYLTPVQKSEWAKISNYGLDKGGGDKQLVITDLGVGVGEWQEEGSLSTAERGRRPGRTLPRSGHYCAASARVPRWRCCPRRSAPPA